MYFQECFPKTEEEWQKPGCYQDGQQASKCSSSCSRIKWLHCQGRGQGETEDRRTNLEQGQAHNGHTVLSSLPLQMLLYFNVFFLPFWCLSEAVMLELKFSLLPLYYQCLLVAAYLTIVGVESARLFLGYVGNLQEKVPELAGFVLLSFVIEMPVLLFILTDHQVIRMPLEMAVHGVLLCFLTSEIVAASFALKDMAKHLARQFYLMQFEGRPGRVRHQEFCEGSQQL
ncbi:transmembrane protein 17B-like [Pantherophis guttatus]|uniref:Transmembrane protein 17B-like n=1 Tax=Pantherophis guttatus TaxID=94885 RepID=A0ABM3YU46_PANGU|nr:transmembrane protein 17B-like [Pantherophis guttatus]